MNPEPLRQQFVISGVGGQGVLFVTRLLAQAAIARGCPVFTSETHGMAQRGGTVMSHLKVGDFSSPLIRPGSADGLLALHAETVRQHGVYVKTAGWIVVNASEPVGDNAAWPTFACDATALALEMGNPRAINLVVLGFAIARTSKYGGGKLETFFSKNDILTILDAWLADSPPMREASLKAFEAGWRSG